MTPVLALLAAVQAVPTTEPPPVVPTNLRALPPLPWRTPPQITPALTSLIADEIKAGGCATPPPVLDLEFAVVVRADGVIKSVVPRAINCAAVEQFGAGLVTSFARNNLRTVAPGWYRATLTFTWGP